MLVAQCLILCDPMDCGSSGPLSIGFSRQEYCSGEPFPSSGDLPDPGIKPKEGAPKSLGSDNQWGFIAGNLRDLGNRDSTLGGHTQGPVCTRTQGWKKQWLHKRLSQAYLLVLEGLLWRQGRRRSCDSLQGQRPWQQQFWKYSLL